MPSKGNLQKFLKRDFLSTCAYCLGHPTAKCGKALKDINNSKLLEETFIYYYYSTGVRESAQRPDVDEENEDRPLVRNSALCPLSTMTLMVG